MTRFFLKEDGTIDRDNPVELAVASSMPAQIVTFYYDSVRRIAQVITLRQSGANVQPNLLVALELHNSRDGLHPEGVVKTYALSKVFYLDNA